jgi:antitoxin (DNA-binding transcriptional repressor) of toxin-antitoxin stability system
MGHRDRSSPCHGSDRPDPPIEGFVPRVTGHNGRECVYICLYTWSWGGSGVPVVGVRELARQVSRLVSEVERSREPAVITRHGKAVALLLPIDSDTLEDFVLTHAPEFADSIREADTELAEGATKPLSAVLADA